MLIALQIYLLGVILFFFYYHLLFLLNKSVYQSLQEVPKNWRSLCILAICIAFSIIWPGFLLFKIYNYFMAPFVGE